MYAALLWSCRGCVGSYSSTTLQEPKAAKRTRAAADATKMSRDDIEAMKKRFSVGGLLARKHVHLWHGCLTHRLVAGRGQVQRWRRSGHVGLRRIKRAQCQEGPQGKEGQEGKEGKEGQEASQKVQALRGGVACRLSTHPPTGAVGLLMNVGIARHLHATLSSIKSHDSAPEQTAVCVACGPPLCPASC